MERVRTLEEEVRAEKELLQRAQDAMLRSQQEAQQRSTHLQQLRNSICSLQVEASRGVDEHGDVVRAERNRKFFFYLLY